MKLFERKFLMACVYLFGVLPGCFAQGGATNQTCSTSIYMSDPYEFTGNFYDGGLVSPANTPSCINSNQNYPLHEVWYHFTTDTVSVFYLYCTSIEGAMEVYTGSCNNLELVSCTPTSQASAYSQFSPGVVQTYYVRLVGYSLPDISPYVLEFNHVDYSPSCGISIDNVEIYPCVNEDGMIPVAISGSLTDPTQLSGGVYVEIDTDENIYFAQDAQTSETWTANFLISGTQITNIYAIYGSSETGCIDVVSNFSLPTEQCATPATLTGNFNWNQHCGQRNGELWLYSPNTDRLKAHYNFTILGDGEFVVEYPILGVYDILIGIDGFLVKGFEDVLIEDTANVMECGTFTGGDLNSDNMINFIDFSILNQWFGMGAPETLPAVDLSCDGVVNFYDFTLLNAGYGIVGATVPL